MAIIINELVYKVLTSHFLFILYVVQERFNGIFKDTLFTKCYQAFEIFEVEKFRRNFFVEYFWNNLNSHQCALNCNVSLKIEGLLDLEITFEISSLHPSLGIYVHLKCLSLREFFSIFKYLKNRTGIARSLEVNVTISAFVMILKTNSKSSDQSNL